MVHYILEMGTMLIRRDRKTLELCFINEDRFFLRTGNSKITRELKERNIADQHRQYN